MGERLRIDVARAVDSDSDVAPASLLVEDGRIVAVGEATDIGERAGETRLDASWLVAVPGFIDCQVNGFGTTDFATANGDAVAAALGDICRQGTTTVMPTIVSLRRSAYPDVLATIAEARASADRRLASADVPGVHLEGPFITPSKRGAHREDAVCAIDEPWFSALLDASPIPVKFVTLAPELDGAEAFIAACTGRGVRVSLGHTDATTEQVLAAVDAGATLVTHLFNAQSQLHHRAPGIVGVALTDLRLHVGMICDGVHVDERVVDIAIASAGGRIFAVSDRVATGGDKAASPLGAPEQARGAAVVAGTTTLAGGSVGLDHVVASLWRRYGAQQAAALTSAHAATALGLDDRGALRAGLRADICLIDPKTLAVAGVVAGGVLAKAPDPAAS